MPWPCEYFLSCTRNATPNLFKYQIWVKYHRLSQVRSLVIKKTLGMVDDHVINTPHNDDAEVKYTVLIVMTGRLVHIK